MRGARARVPASVGPRHQVIKHRQPGPSAVSNPYTAVPAPDTPKTHVILECLQA
jgi:hypothetical protein